MAEIYALEGDASTWEEALKVTADELLARGCVRPDFYESCVEREREYPTGLTNACPVAIPHTTKDHVVREAIAVLRLRRPVEFACIEDASLRVRVRYVFNLALCDSSAHLDLIRHLIGSVKDPGFFRRLDDLPLEDLRGFLAGKFFD
ncbi:PTS sugar transporter subunit IIA [Thermophilibacter sp.]